MLAAIVLDAGLLAALMSLVHYLAAKINSPPSLSAGGTFIDVRFVALSIFAVPFLIVRNYALEEGPHLRDKQETLQNLYVNILILTTAMYIEYSIYLA